MHTKTITIKMSSAFSKKRMFEAQQAKKKKAIVAAARLQTGRLKQ